MRHKDRAPVLAEKNRAAPPVRDFDFAQLGVQIVNPPLDRFEQIFRVASRYVDLREIARVVRVDETCAEDHASVAQAAAPQVRQIHRVKRIPTGEADGFEPLLTDGLGENRERELRLGTTGKSGEFESQGIGGEEDFPGRTLRAACVNNDRSDSMNNRARLPFDLW